MYEIVEIMEIVMRCFVVVGRGTQLSVFLGEYVINKNILEIVGLNLQGFKRVVKLLLWYELGISNVTR